MDPAEEKIKELIKKGKSDLSHEELILLDQLLEKYPYFQAAATINAIQNKRNNNNNGFDVALKNSAVKAPDRNFLYKIINKQTSNISKSDHKQLFKPISDSLSKNEIENNSEKLTEKPKKTVSNVEKIENELHTFEEWLQLINSGSDIKADKTNKTEDVNTIKQKESNEIIDRFIKEKPVIKRAKTEIYSAGNMAQKSVMEDEHLVSETLARINARQGNYNKAIRMYEKLSLLYPDKFDYFAVKIKALKNDLNK